MTKPKTSPETKTPAPAKNTLPELNPTELAAVTGGRRGGGSGRSAN
jgi:hypothetical protein